MRARFLRGWLPLLLIVAVAGCAGKKGPPLNFSTQQFPSGQYVAKTDNFQIVLDASRSMDEYGAVNFATAKGFVSAVNASLPADLAVNGGLRIFGLSEKQSKKETELVYGMAKYAQADFKAGLDKVKFAGGNSPLGKAIDAAAADLEKAGGSAALVIVSDGNQNFMDNAQAAAKAAKAKLGDKLCIYTVWVGDDAAGKKYLEGVAAAGGCGFAESAANLTDPKALAVFVEKVFLTLKPVPPPPPPMAVPAPPPPAPAPPPPPVVKEIITLNLTFDFDKAVIKDEFIPVLEQAKKILDEDPAASFKLSGHTCSIGTDAYNQKLSERRAAAVEKWLVDNGIAANRLEAVGYGESQPKYDNKTEEGRQLNRRVEIQSQ